MYEFHAAQAALSEPFALNSKKNKLAVDMPYLRGMSLDQYLEANSKLDNFIFYCRIFMILYMLLLLLIMGKVGVKVLFFFDLFSGRIYAT